MVRIDLIKLTDDIASCSYFPENNQEWGDGIVTINRKTGEITIEKKMIVELAFTQAMLYRI